jgi:hypothetical protein
MKNTSHTRDIKDSAQRQMLTDSTNVDLDLEQYLCSDRICEQCGNDHNFNPSFEGVKTSMDIIPGLLARSERNLQTNLVADEKKTWPINGVQARAINKTRHLN